jgi:hypothetical protein
MGMPELPGQRRPLDKTVTVSAVADLRPPFSLDEGRRTRLARAVDLLAAFAGCEPHAAAAALLRRADRDREDVEQLAARVIEAMPGDGWDAEQLVVALVEAALAMDSHADPRG